MVARSTMSGGTSRKAATPVFSPTGRMESTSFSEALSTRTVTSWPTRSSEIRVPSCKEDGGLYVMLPYIYTICIYTILIYVLYTICIHYIYYYITII